MLWPWNSFDILNYKLDRITAILNRLVQEENQMAIDLTKLTTEVANNTTVETSVVALVNQLTAIIKAIPVSTDPTTQAALDQLTATLAANDGTIAAAVTANTPSA